MVPQEIVGTVAKYATADALKALSGSTSFLPYVQLMGSTSAAVKEGKFPMGHFALSRAKDSLEDLGDNFVCIIISWRPKAMQYKPEVLSLYNPENSVFKEIEGKAKQPGDTGCGVGPELLLWLPEQQALATFFLGNATGRQEAPNFLTFLGKAATVKSHLIKGKKHTWHGPQVDRCNVEFPAPDWAELADRINGFNNPPDTELEAAEPTEREQ
jgi:hypothetical protein